MELRQLEYVVAVAEEASFTKAAARVNVAQPGVSAQIRRLERELGHDLFDRSGRSVRPTAVGAAVLPYARAALAAVDGARRSVDQLAGLVRGRVQVGMLTACGTPDVAALLAAFHHEHPAVDITLREATSDALVEDVLSGAVDLAFVGLGAEPPPGLDLHVVVDDALIAAVGPAHPLAGRTSVSLPALADLPIISLPPGTGLRTSFDAGCATAGFRPRIAFEASDPSMLGRLAAEGLGVAILAASMAPAFPQLHPIRITKPELRGQIVLAWRAEGPRSPAAEALLHELRRALAPAPARS